MLTSWVVDSRVCSADAEVACGRMVAAWGLTVRSARGVSCECDWDCERALLDLCVFGMGKRASQMGV